MVSLGSPDEQTNDFDSDLNGDLRWTCFLPGGGASPPVFRSTGVQRSL